MLLMDALVDAGRPAEALAAFERVRDDAGRDPRHRPLPRAARTSTSRCSGSADRPTTPPTNLRAALTSFVGRDDDVRAVRGRLAGRPGW